MGETYSGEERVTEQIEEKVNVKNLDRGPEDKQQRKLAFLATSYSYWQTG